MEKSLRENVKQLVNSLLVPHAKGLALDHFLREYEYEERSQFPHRSLGYDSPLSFLQSIPDVVKCTRLGSGHTLLQAVANENISHIKEFVSGQKNTNTSNHYKAIGNLLRKQSYQNQQSFPPSNQCRPSYDSSNGQTANGTKAAYHNSTLAELKEICNTLPNMKIERETKPSIPSTRGLDYEYKLIDEMKELLNRHPNGVQLEQVFDLYMEKFNKPINLRIIGDDMTSLQLFEKHCEIFQVIKNGNEICVALHEFEKNFAPQDSKAERKDYTGAIPKKTSPVGLPPPEAMPRCITNNVKPKWNATDVRARNPDNQSLQTITLAPSPILLSPRQMLPPKPGTARLPAVARNGDPFPASFGVLRPNVTDVFTPDMSLVYEEIPPEADTGYIFVIIAEVYTPGNFYWFLSDKHKAIKSISDDMVLFYNLRSEYAMKRNELYIGQVVAAMYTDELWYRARIVGVHGEKFQVFYVDYGSVGDVSIARMRHLPVHFLKLPIQAHRGRIFGIRHPPEEKKWSSESGKHFLSMVRGNRVIAAARMFQEVAKDNGVPEVHVLELIDTNNEKDVHFSQLLVEDRFAAVNDEDLRKLQEVTGGASSGLTSSISIHTAASSSTYPSDPSPAPTAAFPPSPTNIPSGKPPLVNGHAKEYHTRDSDVTSYRSCSSRKGINARCVKRQILSDGRVLHFIRDDGELYLAGPDVAMLVPNMDFKVESARMKVDFKIVNDDTHSRLFLDCIKMSVPWIMNQKGQFISELKLYQLKLVSSLLIIFEDKDMVARCAIDDQLKDFDDPFLA